MNIRSVLVAVDTVAISFEPVQYAVDLGRTFGAALIGVAAEDLKLTPAGMDAANVAVDFYDLERTEIEKRLRAAEEKFRAQIPVGVICEWRAGIANPSQMVIDAAEVADLIVVGNGAAASADPTRSPGLGQLLLGAGRPVLAVADGATTARADTVMIAWKDTREARRAVADALPFLERATQTIAVTVSEGDSRRERDSLDGLLAWLTRHGIAAQGELLADGGDATEVLRRTAAARNADLVVAGGYGHSRLREWLFGGMTRNLIAAGNLNRLFSN